MEARFAGSQRLGDRRRRRLAVETEDGIDPALTVGELPAADGSGRMVHSAAPEATREPIALPLERLIPVQWWKYALGALAGLLVGGAILTASWYEALGARLVGPGVTRLFALPGAPAAAWFSGLLLNLSAQLALIIWWGRSRSLKDFDGRYRLWTRTAGAWLLLSFCAVTGAHRAWNETVLRLVPAGVLPVESLPWLVPAAIVGLGILVALNREMSGCRASRVLMLCAALCYVASGSLHLPLRIPIASRVRELALAGAAMLGHLCVFLSMWLHARHVLHCTPDPSGKSKRRLRIPRPHFRLPRLGLGQNRSESTDSTEADAREVIESREPKRRGRKVARGDRASAKPAGDAAGDADSAPPRTTRRIDSEPTEPAISIPRKPGSRAAETGEDGPAAEASLPESLGDDEPLTLPPRREFVEAASDAQCPSPPGQAEDSRPDEGDDDDGWTESFPKPDMRGMSKKQRRRLMQELRDKERAQRRQSERA
jgi:hypothetical protein